MVLAGTACWLGGHVTGLAQVVQLPSVRSTAYSGTVVVPDGGSVGLGGLSRSASGTLGRGALPYAGASIGGATSSDSLSVHVQIIDLKALDDAILSSNVPTDVAMRSAVSAGSPASGGGRRVLSTIAQPQMSRRPDLPPAPNAWQLALSTTNISPAVPESIVESNIRFYLERGKAAEQAGHLHSARVFYHLALEAMTPQMRERYQKIVQQRETAEKEKQAQQAKSRLSF